MPQVGMEIRCQVTLPVLDASTATAGKCAGPIPAKAGGVLHGGPEYGCNLICVECTCTMGSQRNSATVLCLVQGYLQGERVCSIISISNPLIFLLRNCLAWNIEILYFLKVCVMPLLIYKKTYISTCFQLTKSHPKRIFAFTETNKKGKKQNQHSAFLLQQACNTGSAAQGPTKLLPWELLYSAFQHPAATALKCVFEHLCFIVIYFMHPLARRVSRYQKSLKL